MRTRDGRNIGVLEVGQAAGVPVFHFHGSGSSRVEALLVAGAAEKTGVRLIALDRPGIGRSDPCDRDRLLDWPDQVVEVADALTPVAVSRLFAAALARCRATFHPHDGRFSTALVHAEEIFAALVRAHQEDEPMTQRSGR
jgi:pimeloyl-ACP methyl ester carboxylesterase